MFNGTIAVFPDGNIPLWEPESLDLQSSELWRWEAQIPQEDYWR